MEDKKTKAAVEGEVAEADAEASRGESVRTELERDGQGDSDASDEETVHDSSEEDVDADDAPASAVKGETRKKKPRAPFTVRERVMLAVSVAAVVFAFAGIGLWAGNAVPKDAAAKVDAAYIQEQSVADWISQYRAANSLQDDARFAQSLLSQNLNVGTFRQNVINQLALAQLVTEEAKKQNALPSDEEVQAEIDRVKESVAFGDDGVWRETLAGYGLDDASIMERYRANLAQRLLCEKVVRHRDATDAELLDYAKSNLVGSTQKHAYRIVFTGEDANARARECYEELLTFDGMSASQFQEIAKKYSDEEGVDESGGDYAWSGGDMSDEAREILETVQVGTFTGLEFISKDDAVEIFFVDEEYAFPDARSISGLKIEDIPEGLRDEVGRSASDAIWAEESNAYLSSLLAAAKITYYPIPDDAAYDVDLAHIQLQGN